MDEAKEFLKNTLPDVDSDKLDFLASHMVTLSFHDRKFDDVRRCYEKENEELRELIINSDKCLDSALQTQTAQQDRIMAQQEQVFRLQEELDNARPQDERSKKEKLRKTEVTNTQTHTKTPDDESLETSVKEIQLEVERLEVDIKSKEQSKKELQEQVNKSEKTIQTYKVKLGLPADASNEEMENKICEMKDQTKELQAVKQSLRKEREISKGLQLDLQDETRKLKHLRTKFQHKELELRQLKQQKKVIIPRNTIDVAKINIPGPRSSVTCEQCHTRLKPVTACDECNTRRLKMALIREGRWLIPQ